MASSDQEQRRIAAALGVEPELLPYLPELLADVRDLCGWPQTIVELLRGAALPPGARALDLGCGKGASTIPLAVELGLRVLGIDQFPPFVEASRAWAEEEGVADLCRFEVGDLHDAVRQLEGFDVVVFAAVGAGVLGDFARCVGELRRSVRAGGYLVIADGFLARAERLDWPGYEYYRRREETRRQLTAHGDALVREAVIPGEELVAYNRKTTELIRARAAELARRHPRLAAAFARYVESEEAECEMLERETVEAVWLLQRPR